jgi:transposase
MKTTTKSTIKPRVRKDYLIPDALWNEIVPVLPKHITHYPLGCHRKRVDDRSAMNAIFFVLKTGCQWNALNATGICSSSSAHRRFQEWNEAGVFRKLWKKSLERYDELKGIDWRVVFQICCLSSCFPKWIKWLEAYTNTVETLPSRTMAVSLNWRQD